MKWLLILISFLAIACDKDSFKQDPLEGQPERIRNGTPPDLRKPDVRPACPTNSLILESSPRVGMFEEGKEGSMAITGRVLKCGSDEYDIEILNLPEGATFDLSTGILQYTPPYALVQGSNYYIERQLKVRMKTRTEPVVIKEANIVYFVRRPSGRKPVIESFKDLPDKINEGEDSQFQVAVRDEDASRGPNDTVYPPRLNLITTIHDERNALPFLSIYNSSHPTQDPNDKSLWWFKVNLRTQGYENVVNRNITVKFGMVAVSQFGVLSDVAEENFEIINRVKVPNVTWPEVKVEGYEFTKGVKNQMTFWAVDPFKEGYTQVNFLTDCSKFSGTASCSCKYVGNTWSSSMENGSFCTIEWDIPKDYKEDRQDFSFEVRNTNFKDKSNYQELSLKRTIFILEAGATRIPPDEEAPIENPPEDKPKDPIPPGSDKGPIAFDNSKGVHL